MNILYAVNKKYIDIMLASILSLIENSGFKDINLHIVEEGFTKEDFDKVKKFIDLFSKANVKFYDFSNCPIESLNIPNWKGTQIANARILYPSIIKDKENIDNLLYLDSDTIITGNINDIEKYNNHLITACKEDATLKTYYKSLNLDKYINSGVLYFNCNEWSKIDLHDKIKDLTSNNNIKLTYPDQDLINILFNDSINIMPTRYNLSPYPFLFNNCENMLFYSRRQLSYKEIIEEKKHAKILHSYGFFDIKPWCSNSINPFSQIFLNYAYRSNVKFDLEELKNAKKFFNEHSDLYKSVLIAKTFLPSSIEEKSRQISLKLKNK